MITDRVRCKDTRKLFAGLSLTEEDVSQVSNMMMLSQNKNFTFFPDKGVNPCLSFPDVHVLSSDFMNCLLWYFCIIRMLHVYITIK